MTKHEQNDAQSQISGVKYFYFFAEITRKKIRTHQLDFMCGYY